MLSQVFCLESVASAEGSRFRLNMAKVLYPYGSHELGACASQEAVLIEVSDKRNRLCEVIAAD